MTDTILVVDDNEAMLHAVSRLMTRAGYTVVQASSGRECLALAEKEHPKLILLDVQLPDMDGIQVLKRLKAKPETEHIFVVHLSAERTDVESKAAGLEHGADGYISQPVDNRELVARVRGFLRHKAALDNLRASEARYRHLFECNPQPMWVLDRAESRFVAVNDSAVKHYGFSEGEFHAFSPSRLIVNAELEEDDVPTLSAFDLRQQHRRKDGSIIDVEISRHAMRWMDIDAVVFQIVDVTAWKHVERERKQLLQRYEREVAALDRISKARQQRRTSPPAAPLQDSVPEQFAEFESEYERLLTLALEQRIYKVDHEVSAGLRQLAERLFELRSSPRDVINLHCSTLKKLVPEPSVPKGQGYVEIGRLAIVELMGYLVSAYRDFALNGAVRS